MACRVLLLALAVSEAAWLPALVAQGQLFSNARFQSNRHGHGAQKQHPHPQKASSLLNRMRARPRAPRAVSMHEERLETSNGIQFGAAKAGKLVVKAGTAPTLQRKSGPGQGAMAPFKKPVSQKGKGVAPNSYAGKADHTAKLKADKASELILAKTAAAAKAKKAEKLAASAEAKAEQAVLTAEARALAMFKTKADGVSAKATDPTATSAEAVKAALVSLGTPADSALPRNEENQAAAPSDASLPVPAEQPVLAVAAPVVQSMPPSIAQTSATKVELDAVASPVALDAASKTQDAAVAEQEAEIAAAEKAVNDATAAAASARAEQEAELEQVAKAEKEVELSAGLMAEQEAKAAAEDRAGRAKAEREAAAKSAILAVKAQQEAAAVNARFQQQAGQQAEASALAKAERAQAQAEKALAKVKAAQETEAVARGDAPTWDNAPTWDDSDSTPSQELAKAKLDQAAEATATAKVDQQAQEAPQHGQTATLGSAPARLLLLLRARLVVPRSSALPG